MISTRWEHGSDFDWPRFVPVTQPTPWPWDDSAPLLVGSGRDALVLVLQHGMATRSWRRLWVPGYMCQEVVAAAASTGIRVGSYSCDVESGVSDVSLPRLESGDVILDVNFFGLGRRSLPEIPCGVDVIEDHTHDPLSQWAFGSVVDFAVASLRKTLPLPVGGVLWSPSGHELPAPPPLTDVRERSSLQRFSAMQLKALYLAGHEIAKSSFRSLAGLAEQSIGSGDPSAMPEWAQNLLRALPAEKWRGERGSNHRELVGLLESIRGLEVLETTDGLSAPFSAVLVLPSQAVRDQLRADLIRRDIYPAILWPLEDAIVGGQDPRDLDLSRRVLSIHCDWRYGSADLERVAEAIAVSLRDSNMVR